MSNIPPRYELPIADKNGRISREWYKYLVQVGISQGGSLSSADDSQLSSNADTAQSESLAISANKNASQALGMFLLTGEDKPQSQDNALLMMTDESAGANPAANIKWTGNHTFAPSSGTAVSITTPDNLAALIFNDGSPVSGYYIAFKNSGVLEGAVGLGGILFSGAGVSDFGIQGTNNLRLSGGGRSSADLLFASATGNATFSAPIGVSGNAPPAQSTGWGTPANGTVVSSYNATTEGGTNTTKAVAMILSILKSIGFLGA